MTALGILLTSDTATMSLRARQDRIGPGNHILRTGTTTRDFKGSPGHRVAIPRYKRLIILLTKRVEKLAGKRSVDFENCNVSTVEKLAQGDIEILQKGTNRMRHNRYKKQHQGEKVLDAN